MKKKLYAMTLRIPLDLKVKLEAYQAQHYHTSLGGAILDLAQQGLDYRKLFVKQLSSEGVLNFDIAAGDMEGSEPKPPVKPLPKPDRKPGESGAKSA